MQFELQNSPTSVLVIDDDPGISRLIKCNLESSDTQVFEAASGSDGVRILQEETVDLLLLDLRLPDLNGWEILDHLRSVDLLRELPVIVISAEPPSRTLIQQFAVDDYIEKPFDVRDLVLRVKKVIGLREALLQAA